VLKKQIALAIALAMTLTACQATQTTVTDMSCLSFKKIPFSGKNDTPETVEKVREHNSALSVLCD